MNTQEILKPIAGDFEEWYEETLGTQIFKSRENPNECVLVQLQDFYMLPIDFQLGVLLRYFRERGGMDIAIKLAWKDDKKQYWFRTMMVNELSFDFFDPNFNIAFEQALIKAVEFIKRRIDETS